MKTAPLVKQDGVKEDFVTKSWGTKKRKTLTKRVPNIPVYALPAAGRGGSRWWPQYTPMRSHISPTLLLAPAVLGELAQKALFR